MLKARLGNGNKSLWKIKLPSWDFYGRFTKKINLLESQCGLESLSLFTAYLKYFALLKFLLRVDVNRLLKQDHPSIINSNNLRTKRFVGEKDVDPDLMAFTSVPPPSPPL